MADVPPGTSDTDVVVIDLDETEPDGLPGPGSAGRVIGYFSHVDEGTGAAAREAGIETYTRGRFWRDLDSILFGRGPEAPVG